METLPGCWAKMQFFADAFRPGPDDVHLLYLPMAHVFGLRLAMLALLSGGRLVLMERFSPRGALELIAEEGVTVLPGMPAHFTLLLRRPRPDRAPGRQPAVGDLRRLHPPAGARRPHLRSVGRGPALRLRVQRELHRPHDRPRRRSGAARSAGSCSKGRRAPRPTARSPSSSRAAPSRLPAGAVGELAFGADHPVRYWKDADAATDGWYRTGDLGRVDPDGSVYILGRLKELINRGGLHVSPSEVETAVRAHPGVADSAVVATPDPVVGEAICACVVAGPAGRPPALGELRDFLAPVLARHKLPDELCLVDAIPRTKIGKVDRAGPPGDRAGGRPAPGAVAR